MDPTAPSHTTYLAPSTPPTNADNCVQTATTTTSNTIMSSTTPNTPNISDAPLNPIDVAQIIKAAQLMNSMAAAGCSSTTELEHLVTAALGKKSDSVPRRKPKTKSNSSPSAVAATSATITLPIDNHAVVQKHLDEWLDGCLKDAPLTSSSSEFLDNNFPSLNHNGSTSSQPRGGPTMINHNSNSNTNTTNPNHLPSYSNNPTTASAAQAAAFYLNSSGGGGAGVFTAPPKPSDTPTRSGGGGGGGLHDPFNGGYQRYFPMYPPNYGGGAAGPNGHHMPSYLNGGMANMGLGSRQSNMNSDFSSLPPAVNMMNHGKDLRIDAQDILDGLDHRHFSDPCLAGASDDSKDSGNGPNGRSSNSTKNDSTKMLSTILEQIGVLHETNTKICRSLHDNKVDIEALKHAPSWGGMRHRRDSISGLSTHSQPLGGYAFGTHSPAPTFHSGMYTPGMLTDVVREVKDAARIREEALLNRVKAMVEERSWMINDTNVKMMRELEEMKTQINNLKSERHDTKSQIGKMEDEIKSLRALLTHFLQATAASQSPPRASSSGYNHPLQNSQSFNERDYSGGRPSANRLAHRSSLNINYGTISNHDDVDLGFPTEDDIILPMNQQFNDIRKAEKLKYSQSNGKHSRESVDHDAPTSDGHIVQMEKDTLELRRELQDALAGKKQAENKVLTLENIVLKLQNGVAIHESDTQHNTHPNSRNSSFSEGPAHTSSSSSTVITAGKSQQQQQHYHSTPNSSKHSNNSVGLTGPVTDL